jgi:protocatechuate 3,4-dioxygenase beta subunit
VKSGDVESCDSGNIEVIKRRTIVLGGIALLAGSAATWLMRPSPGAGEPISLRRYDWNAADFRIGGTGGVPADLPPPLFRAKPQCVTTRAKILGPCHTNDVAIRSDVTDGVRGLPTRVSLRIVDAADCHPVDGADVEIWHADVRGVYSGRAANMCNPRDETIRGATFLRGRQITNSDGCVDFLTVYPGWYPGRAVHIHLRILIGGRELLITQLLFDDTLNDLIYQNHPDYAERPLRETMNGGDAVFSPTDAAQFMFDVEKLESGVLQASYTIGVALI